MGTEKDFFDNDPMLRYVLKNFDISSKEAFEKSKEDLYYKLKDKPILNGLELMSLPAEQTITLLKKWYGSVTLCLFWLQRRPESQFLGYKWPVR
jgi:hypothetical protein